MSPASRAKAPRHFLLPTPAGAYFASAEPANDRLRGFIRLLFAQAVTPRWRDEDDGFVRRLAGAGWVQYLRAPRSAIGDPVETALPRLLPALSGDRRALLADAHGFHLASTGLDDTLAEELAALSADLASLHSRHRRPLAQDLRMYGSAWAIPDAAGRTGRRRGGPLAPLVDPRRRRRCGKTGLEAARMPVASGAGESPGPCRDSPCARPPPPVASPDPASARQRPARPLPSLGLLLSLYLAQGLPGGFLTQALPAILRQYQVPLGWIGFSGILLAPAAFKFLWAPWVDRHFSPRLGLARSFQVSSLLPGFSALETINRQCARRSIDWVLVAGTEVARLLRVCDTDGALPVAGNIVSGVATLARGPHRQLQLTPLTSLACSALLDRAIAEQGAPEGLHQLVLADRDDSAALLDDKRDSWLLALTASRSTTGLARLNLAGQCISVGREAGTVQLSRPDDSPRRAYLGGRIGALVKEQVCRFTVSTLRREARKPGAVVWLKSDWRDQAVRERVDV